METTKTLSMQCIIDERSHEGMERNADGSIYRSITLRGCVFDPPDDGPCIDVSSQIFHGQKILLNVTTNLDKERIFARAEAEGLNSICGYVHIKKDVQSEVFEIDGDKIVEPAIRIYLHCSDSEFDAAGEAVERALKNRKTILFNFELAGRSLPNKSGMFYHCYLRDLDTSKEQLYTIQSFSVNTTQEAITPQHSRRIRPLKHNQKETSAFRLRIDSADLSFLVTRGYAENFNCEGTVLSHRAPEHYPETFSIKFVEYERDQKQGAYPEEAPAGWCCYYPAAEYSKPRLDLSLHWQHKDLYDVLLPTIFQSRAESKIIVTVYIDNTQEEILNCADRKFFNVLHYSISISRMFNPQS